MGQVVLVAQASTITGIEWVLVVKRRIVVTFGLAAVCREQSQGENKVGGDPHHNWQLQGTAASMSGQAAPVAALSSLMVRGRSKLTWATMHGGHGGLPTATFRATSAT